MTTTDDTSFFSSSGPDYSAIKSELSVFSDDSVEYGRGKGAVDASMDITSTLFIREKRQRFLDDLTGPKKEVGNYDNTEFLTGLKLASNTHKLRNLIKTIGEKNILDKQENGEELDSSKFDNVEFNSSKFNKEQYNSNKFDKNLSNKEHVDKDQFETEKPRKLSLKSKINLDNTSELETFGRRLTNADKLLSSAIAESTFQLKSLRLENRKLNRKNQMLESQNSLSQRRLGALQKDLESLELLKAQLVKKVHKYKAKSESQQAEIELLRLQKELYKLVFDALLSDESLQLKSAIKTVDNLGQKAKNVTGDKTSSIDNKIHIADIKETVIQSKEEIMTKLNEFSPIINQTKETQEVREILEKYNKRQNIAAELKKLDNDENLNSLTELFTAIAVNNKSKHDNIEKHADNMQSSSPKLTKEPRSADQLDNSDLESYLQNKDPQILQRLGLSFNKGCAFCDT